MRLALAIALNLSLATPAIADLSTPTGQTILTLGGAISETNRGPATTDDLSVLAKMDLSFDKGAAFDLEMLAALPQTTIETDMPGDDTRAATFTGPLLTDVMEAVGATGKSAFPMALDGYSIEITWDDMTSNGPILATHLNGTPLGIGTLGPTMTVYPKLADADAYEAALARQVWATFYIDIE